MSYQRMKFSHQKINTILLLKGECFSFSSPVVYQLIADSGSETREGQTSVSYRRDVQTVQRRAGETTDATFPG